MIKKLIILSLALTAVGCAGVKTVPLSEESIPMIEGRAISGSFSNEKPGFAAMTAGKGAFGALGAVAMISAGNKLIAENNVEDPADYIYEALATELAKQYALRLLEGSRVETSGAKLDELSAQVNDSRLLLDVRTVGWNFVYFPTTWNKYKVGYSAMLRLIDTSTKEVLAESMCSKTSHEDSDTAPTYDELVANQAERLKQELHAAANYCIKDFKGNTLRL
ncbi:hypothetical protein [Microbulbifer taiwanensis]|uniref:Lipoprotein n=1 Tax=Microbulbifer taiwanensis TaxID=986746 RepID=A0ABW1YKM2_9GAMM|nr:hypothetical protein [Microbulbifer taiwanensis]